MTLSPHYLQLGFLKLLPGTKLAAERHLHGYAAESFPPYEVVKSRDISVADLALLKQMDGFMDTVYNKGILKQTLCYAMKRNGYPTFELFTALSQGTDFVSALENFLPERENVWSSLTRLDCFLNGNGGSVTPEEENEINAFVQDREKVSVFLPHYANETPREIYKRTRILIFPVRFTFNEKSMVTNISEGESKILLDYHEKGKQKRRKQKPTLYVL